MTSPCAERIARRLFAFSIVYLFALFGVFLADKQLAAHFIFTRFM